jgi:integrase
MLAYWWAERRKKCTAASTANKYLTEMKKCLNRAVEWGYVEKNVAQKLKKLDEAERCNVLTDEMRDAITNSGTNPNLKPYIMVARYTAARRASMFHLRVKDVDFKREAIFFRHAKRCPKGYTLPLHPALAAYLKEYLKRFLQWGRPLQADDYLLPRYKTPASITLAFRRHARWLNKAYSDQGIDFTGFTLHDMRHDFASQLANGGQGEHMIMKWLNHKTPSMTKRYAHIVDAAARKAALTCIK